MFEGSCTYIILGKYVSRVFEDLQKTNAPQQEIRKQRRRVNLSPINLAQITN
jgi:hypothetical protein